MITKDNFKNVLKKLGFTEEHDCFRKKIGQSELKADFTKQELIYPKAQGLKINERHTCNFNNPENFVVFECVCRLLEKGYNPKHIELEPKWKLGHGASGGRADIWIKDNKGVSLLIIECKNAGKDFENAWKDTLEDGGQLFSYLQQERDTRFVALYSSDFIDNEINYEYKMIAVRDNDEHLKRFGNKKVPNFKNANTVKNIFNAWEETYRKDFSTRGLFEQDVTAYSIGKSKYSIADLKEVDGDSIQKKYHEFATILRQHNVSGHENAFDKLVNLFLAKIVDEITNKYELAFYWKGVAYDDVKNLVDRLSKHYKIGMEKFLNEDVTYIEKSEIEDAFVLFKNKPNAIKDKILEYFDQLKYYTNNEFTFIDVHNEKLFYQNAEVLLKVVQMLQDIKLQTETQNQFLGDMFEGFLDKGIKQSEGQFFTPTPIVKFLISCLPLEEIISKSIEIPKVIDYACGAGHFLNEYANQIFRFVKKTHIKDNYEVDNDDPQKIKKYYAQIIGIEKEYRLSKVAKVSAFMYGQDDIKIIYADALAKKTKIKDGIFSVLVTNPPYSVKGFLETLDDESLQRFELFKSVDDKQKKTNNSIECFFVERAKQLLKAGGVAAIILPSSILNNKDGVYTKTREILLKYFDIIAIAEFGSGTFGKTGTNTATLFLRRKSDTPALAEHYRNRVKAWFECDFSVDEVFEDKNLLEKYCEKIGIPFEDYKTLLSNMTPNHKLLTTDIFKEYHKDFMSSAQYKNIIKKRITANYSENDRDAEVEKTYIKYMQNIEMEKLYYFMLAESNPRPVVLVKSPADNKAIKTFLGYEWSAAKGNEGIKYINANVSNSDDAISKNMSINQIKTPLFNPSDLNDETKINTIVRNNFNGLTCQSNEFVSFAKLSDMLDFSRVSFDNAIKTSPEKKIEITSKYELVKLGDYIIEKGKSNIQVNKAKENTTGQYPFFTSGETEYRYDSALVDGKNIYMSTGGNAHIKFYDGKASYSTDTYCFTTKENIEPYFVYLIIFSKTNEINREYFKGQGLKHLQKKDFKEIKIPLPPLDIQRTIITECEKVDKEYNTSRMTIEEYKKKITKVFELGGVIIS